MKYRTRPRASGVEIQIDDLGQDENRLLEAFEECRQGRCSCPTDEYTKLEELAVKKDDGSIRLELSAKEGETFDATEIERCLDYTASKLSTGRDGDGEDR